MFRHFLKKAALLSALEGGTGNRAALNKSASIQATAQDVLFEKAAAAVQALDEYEAAFDLYKYASAVEPQDQSNILVPSLAGIGGAYVGQAAGHGLSRATVGFAMDPFTNPGMHWHMIDNAASGVGDTLRALINPAAAHRDLRNSVAFHKGLLDAGPAIHDSEAMTARNKVFYKALKRHAIASPVLSTLGALGLGAAAYSAAGGKLPDVSQWS